MAGNPAQGKIHVVEVLDATNGGTRTHLLQILQGLDRQRFTLTFIASAERYPLFRNDMERLRSEGIDVIEVAIVRPISPWRDFQALRRLTTLFQRLKPDIVHTHASKSGVLGRIAAERAGVRCVIHTPHVFYFQGKNGPARWFYRQIERAMLPRTGRLVVLTEGQRRIARYELGAEERQLVMIPNGVDTDRFAPRDRQVARELLGLPPDGPVIGTLTRFVPQKRCELFFEAVGRVMEKRSRTWCLVVGDGPLRQRLMCLARRLGVLERMVWRPHSEEPMEIYAAMDLFALSSRYEGMPYALLEAMSAGLPVVVPRITGCAEMIEHGTTGLLVAPGDRQELAKGMLQLLDDPTRARCLGVSAREAVKRCYPLARFLDRLSQLYEEAHAGMTSETLL